MTMQISGWGNYPHIHATGTYFETTQQLNRILESSGDCIPYGMGRSYGDSALNQRVVFSHRFNKVLEFDAGAGIIKCESGVHLADLIETYLPQGWFLSTTPGTKYVSIGGAIASDVHGKNQHKSGSFSDTVLSLELMLPDGKTIQCSREDNRELFLATCGGMGLTGYILSATFILQPVLSASISETSIRCRNLEETFSFFEKYESKTYSVAWLDCLAKGETLGRSILMVGEHSELDESDFPEIKPSVSMPFYLPGFILNKYSISLFNHLYYYKSPKYAENRIVSLDSFFYPLDMIGKWNRMYGRKGFLQYQMVLPKDASFEGMSCILNKTSSTGIGSFLAVMKLFGPGNDNYLSFPMEGYTLALDFKIEKKLSPLLDELDRIVLDYGGRFYLAKDSRVKRNVFIKGYPKLAEFTALRKQMKMDIKFNSLQSKRLGL